jgi:hypothetical protein
VKWGKTKNYSRIKKFGFAAMKSKNSLEAAIAKVRVAAFSPASSLPSHPFGGYAGLDPVCERH